MHKWHLNFDSSQTVPFVVIGVMREDTTGALVLPLRTGIRNPSCAKGWEFERKLYAKAHTLYHCTPGPWALSSLHHWLSSLT